MEEIEMKCPKDFIDNEEFKQRYELTASQFKKIVSLPYFPAWVIWPLVRIPRKAFDRFCEDPTLIIQFKSDLMKIKNKGGVKS